MLSLYLLLSIMLGVAMSVIAVPFYKNGLLVSRYCLGLCLLTMTSAGLLYVMSSNQVELQSWLTEGKARYLLLEKFQALGGVDGAIKRIQEKLKSDGDNVEGWLLLGKLYLTKQDFPRSKAAFLRAQELKSRP